MEKEHILFYLQHYLSPSMTFIYRQLLGVSEEFDPFVLSSRKKENLNLFPHKNISFNASSYFIDKLSRVKELLFNLPPYSYISINPTIYFNQRIKHIKYIKNNNCKLIHAHFGPSGIEVLPIAKKLNLPLIVSFHGYDASTLLKFEKYRVNLKTLFNYAHIITPSKYMLQSFHLVDLYCKNEYVVHYGIPVDFFEFKNRVQINRKTAKKEEIIFLQISNFVEKKGHKYTIHAFNNFLKKYSNAILILAGEGPLRKSMISLVKELGITEKIKFPGLVHQETVRELMYSADVFVHHSVTGHDGDKEGIPNVIMEAMATGLPVISTHHSAIPELIDDGVNGFLVPEKDVQSYELVMLKTLSLDDKMGINGRKKILQDFNSEIENQKLISIYNNF